MNAIINCTSLKSGHCTHPAAPKPLFGHPTCIAQNPTPDPRIPKGCAFEIKASQPLIIKRPLPFPHLSEKEMA